MMHPEDREAALSRWRAAVQARAPLSQELRIRRHDGEMRWHLVRAIPIRCGDAELPRWVATCSDIHDERERRARQEAEALVERHMVGIVSHDLRGPMHSILLGLDALQMQGPTSPRWRMTLERIRSAAQRGSRMIHDLLDFTLARQGGGMAIRPLPVDLCDVVGRVIDEVSSSYPDRHLEARHQGPQVGAWDADRLAQAIGNLVNNAVAYGDAARPVVVSTRADGADEVMIEVHNDGAAIPGATQASLFLPMRRGASSSERSRRSIGLGLFIVREIAAGHGGTVEVESSASAGTTFRIRLPRHPRGSVPPEGLSAGA